MSIATFVIGESGTGKTCSLRDLKASDVLLIQCTNKPLSFKPDGWKELKGTFNEATGEFKPTQAGNYIFTRDLNTIRALMTSSKKPIIIIDDFQYLLSDVYMARRKETGFQKFTDIGGIGYDVVKLATELDSDKRVYILAHSSTDDSGTTRIKTLGKLLDDKIVLEGMVTNVLRTYVENNEYYFGTQNSGSDTVKTPLGMFDEPFIPNNLALVDSKICEFYGIEQPKSKKE